MTGTTGIRGQGSGIRQPPLPPLSASDRTPPDPLSLIPDPSSSGLTLVELIVVVSIIAILATAAIPVAKYQVKRAHERELREDLLTMRAAIDAYKDAAVRGAFQTKVNSFNYPPDLQTLVDGVDCVAGTAIGSSGDIKKVKFLHKIPIDPMTGRADWALRSMADDPGTESEGGDNVFDVHSKSDQTAIDGTKYNTW
jgi:general secretion pathway protein G